MYKLIGFLLLVSTLSFATSTETRVKVTNGRSDEYLERVTIKWNAEAGGTVPTIPVRLYGELVNILLEPGWSAYGGSAPTDAYDVALLPSLNGTQYDILSSQLADLDYKTMYSFVPTSAAAIAQNPTYNHPVFSGNTYYLTITGNTNASADGSVVFFMRPFN